MGCAVLAAGLSQFLGPGRSALRTDVARNACRAQLDGAHLRRPAILRQAGSLSLAPNNVVLGARRHGICGAPSAGDCRAWSRRMYRMARRRVVHSQHRRVGRADARAAAGNICAVGLCHPRHALHDVHFRRRRAADGRGSERTAASAIPGLRLYRPRRSDEGTRCAGIAGPGVGIQPSAGAGGAPEIALTALMRRAGGRRSVLAAMVRVDVDSLRWCICRRLRVEGKRVAVRKIALRASVLAIRLSPRVACRTSAVDADRPGAPR